MLERAHEQKINAIGSPSGAQLSAIGRKLVPVRIYAEVDNSSVAPERRSRIEVECDIAFSFGTLYYVLRLSTHDARHRQAKGQERLKLHGIPLKCCVGSYKILFAR